MHFFVLPSQPFIYRAKRCYWSWMLTLCHWSHDFPAEGCLLFPLHRKPLEMFTSRALCTEPWRQILVIFFDLYHFVRANIKEITRLHLSCRRDITQNNSVIMRLRYRNKKKQRSFVCANDISFSSSVFSFSREIHLLWWAEPRCAEEAVRAWKKDVPHYQQPVWLCVSVSKQECKRLSARLIKNVMYLCANI